MSDLGETVLLVLVVLIASAAGASARPASEAHGRGLVRGPRPRERVRAAAFDVKSRAIVGGSVGLVVVLAAATLGGSADAGTGSGPDDSGQQWISNGALVFSGYDPRTGTYAVKTVNADGPPVVRVVVPDTQRVSAAPTAPLLAFQVVRDGVRWLAVSALDGSRMRTVTEGGDWIMWTSDSSRLLFTRAGSPLYYSIRPDGTDPRPYPANVRGVPSPDGTRFAYVTRNDMSKVRVVNADGTGDRRLTSGGPFVSESGPLWSPDGSRLAYGISDYGGREETRSLAVTRIGGPARAFTLAGNAWCCSPSVWSPDGSTIFGSAPLRGPTSAAERDRDRLRLIRTGSAGAGLVGFDVASGKKRVVLHGISNAVFSPDGTRIAYEAEGECGSVHHIYIANADGSGRRLVTGNCHIVGTPGPDVLHGQVVIGLGGNDTLNGTETLDKLYGGPGDDVLVGAASADVLVGGLGHDHLYGDNGSDLIDARDGQRDWISCGANGYQGGGRDTVYADRLDIVSPDCEIVHRS